MSTIHQQGKITTTLGGVLLLFAACCQVGKAAVIEDESLWAGRSLRVSTSTSKRHRFLLPDWLCTMFMGIIDDHCAAGDDGGDADNTTNLTLGNLTVTCPPVEPLHTITPSNSGSNGTANLLDANQVFRGTWFVQKQQVNGWQPSLNDFYCLAMTFQDYVEEEEMEENADDDDDALLPSLPTDDEEVNGDDNGDGGDNPDQMVDVSRVESTASSKNGQEGPPQFWQFDYLGVTGGVTNGTQQDWRNDDAYCAALDDTGDGIFRVGPCAIRPILVRAGMPFVVLAVAKDGSWMIVSGGIPDEVQQLNPVMCTTTTEVTNVLAEAAGSGLWLMTRQSQADDNVIANMEDWLINRGVYTGLLYDVEQAGCQYGNVTLPL